MTLSNSPTPRLIHPITVILELIDRDDSVFDDYAREPIGQVMREGESPRSGDRVTIKAQVSYHYAGAKQNYIRYDREGVVEETLGYFAVRYKDLERQGLLTVDATGKFTDMKIKRGSRVLQVGHEEVDYYVTGFKPFGHYPRPKQTMIQINFDDRHPGYQQGDL